jgi:SAM-dependent methyltransferase
METAPADRAVACTKGHSFEMDDGYLDLSSRETTGAVTHRTFESFGYEWNTFDDVRAEDEQFSRVYFEDLDLASLSGKIALDAGCGKGRYTRFVAPHAGALLALDGSSAAAAAARNLSDQPNVLVVKADLRQPPISPSSLDFVMCLGVLHHLEDPRAGFFSLVDLLVPGGRILLYLYSRPTRPGVRMAALWVARELRKLTVRLPHRALRIACVPIAAALFAVAVQPGALGDRLRLAPLSRFPMSAYRGKPFRSLVLDTFDRLSAPVEHRFVREELDAWVEQAGLQLEAAREKDGWFLLARRPVG